MHTLLVRLKPLEPYFFGGERTFTYQDINLPSSGGYFIRSLKTPAQTTLFGILRYLGMRFSKFYEHEPMSVDERGKRIGTQSFDLLKPKDGSNSFGLINRISPLFIIEGERHFYVRTPMDHTNNDLYRYYTPWSLFYQTLTRTNEGERRLPKKTSYDEKNDISDSWLCLDALQITNDLFQSVTQTGVAKKAEVDGLFRQEFCLLKKGLMGKELSFAFFAEVGDGFMFDDQIVYLGQGKSSFLAAGRQIEPDMGANMDDAIQNVTAQLRCALRPNTVYALSDWFIGGRDKEEMQINMRQLYNACELVVTDNREFRSLTTNYTENFANTAQKNKYTRSEAITRLISTGSVFTVQNFDLFNESFIRTINHKHAQTAGFNAFLKGDVK